MNTGDLAPSLATLFSELVNGVPASAASILNKGDVGLLRSLDKLSAADASSIHAGGASIASHVDHLRCGLALMNQWAGGSNPWDDADWTVSWRKTKVSDADWRALRTALGGETHRWLTAMRQPREVDETELNGIIASVAHLAYHLGAIRQMDRAVRGPSANE